MSKKANKELLSKDLYKELGIEISATEKEIKRAFRKKALVCHPDKNPDNPDASTQFNKLKKILEIFLDPGAREAYDKVLRARKAAALRTKEQSLKAQKYRRDLEERELTYKQNADSMISQEERLIREIKRLEDEGAILIQEEIDNLNREARNSNEFQSPASSLPTASQNSSQTASNFDSKKEDKDDCPVRRRVKAKWTCPDDVEQDYNKEDIQKLFYKWGVIEAIVMKKKGKKRTGLIEYKTRAGADFAVQFEKGLTGRPITVNACEVRKPKTDERPEDDAAKTKLDYESVVDMQKRRERERKEIIRQMMEEDRTA